MITSSAITDNGLQLSWTRASDEKTSQLELEYRVYRAESSSIATPADAELNGTPLGEWTADAIALGVSGLDSGRTYYFNVVVRAPDGRKAAYVMVAATTVGVVRMYSAGLHKGNLTTPFTASARADIDAICRAKVVTPTPANVRAFINISADDAISDFPSHYGVPANWPVKSLTSSQIAWTWDDMLNGSIDMKLVKAGIADDFWWSGSTEDGSFDTQHNCSGWTDGTSSSDGMAGFHNELSGEWIARDARNCNNEYLVLCVGW